METISCQQLVKADHLLKEYNDAINSGMPALVSNDRRDKAEEELIGTYYNPMTNSEVQYVKYEIPMEAFVSPKRYMQMLKTAYEGDESRKSHIQHSSSYENISKIIAQCISNIHNAISTISLKTQKNEELMGELNDIEMSFV